MIPSFLHRLFEVDVRVCLETGDMRRTSNSFWQLDRLLSVKCPNAHIFQSCYDCKSDIEYKYNVLTRELRVPSDRCPHNPGKICSEHAGKPTEHWEKCSCCKNKRVFEVAGS